MKKHILFIVENIPAPIDIRVWAQARTAKKMGYEVSIISPENEMTYGKYQKIDEIEIYRHREVKVGSGIRNFVFELINALFWEFLLSIRIYRKKPFQIIHAANPPDHIFLIALFYKLFGVKFIFDHHDLSPELYLTKFNNRKNIVYQILVLLEKISCKISDAVITTNMSYKKIAIQRHAIKEQKIFIVRNDPAWENFKSLEKPIKRNKKNKIEILFLGSINTQDGVNELLKALNHLVRYSKVQGFICNIVGGGDSLQSNKNLCKELNLENFVDFKGWVFSKPKVREYLYAADICIEPAPDNLLNRHSTFIKIMEYMVAGKPIVAFDLIETRFSTNNSALLVKPGDTIGLSNAIKKLIDNPKLREELGAKARERIKNMLNWENAALNLAKAYKSIP